MKGNLAGRNGKSSGGFETRYAVVWTLIVGCCGRRLQQNVVQQAGGGLFHAGAKIPDHFAVVSKMVSIESGTEKTLKEFTP
jgi:hypothetical protein